MTKAWRVVGLVVGPPAVAHDAESPPSLVGAAAAPAATFMARLAGLWSGPATMTRLGDFPVENMHFRPASNHVLLGRVDLDADNSLRFAFMIETLGGRDVLARGDGGLEQAAAHR